ncbi:unnamed protein product, partial [Cyprideis torosa]
PAENIFNPLTQSPQGKLPELIRNIFLRVSRNLQVARSDDSTALDHHKGSICEAEFPCQRKRVGKSVQQESAPSGSRRRLHDSLRIGCPRHGLIRLIPFLAFLIMEAFDAMFACTGNIWSRNQMMESNW